MRRDQQQNCIFIYEWVRRSHEDKKKSSKKKLKCTVYWNDSIFFLF